MDVFEVELLFVKDGTVALVPLPRRDIGEPVVIALRLGPELPIGDTVRISYASELRLRFIKSSWFLVLARSIVQAG